MNAQQVGELQLAAERRAVVAVGAASKYDGAVRHHRPIGMSLAMIFQVARDAASAP